jgi:sirohydrochlorin ferrochelatase
LQAAPDLPYTDSGKNKMAANRGKIAIIYFVGESKAAGLTYNTAIHALAGESAEMKVLLLIAHGSRKQSANDEIRRLALRVQALCGEEYAAVVAAFLECAEPGIQQGVDRCVELGATEVVAVPYFLAAGKHVAMDIPAELACASAGYPQLKIEMSQYVGDNDAMPELVLRCSKQAGGAG